jgi:hypothetical protein
MITHARCTTIPVAKPGYSVGCELVKTNAVFGQYPRWINQGTVLSCSFRPNSAVIGFGFSAAGSQLFASGAAGLILNLPETTTAMDIALATHKTSDDNDQLISVVSGPGIVTITNSVDPLAAHSAFFGLLRPGCTPSHDIFAAGTFALLGGAAAEAITIAGALPSDIALVQYAATDDTDTISKAVMTANTLTVTMSADPLAAHALHYVILRARGSFKPSHYVFAAASVVTVGGAAAEPITVAGALATDVAIVNYAVTDDTDAIRKAVVTANTLTITCSADPGATHTLSYALIRAY